MKLLKKKKENQVKQIGKTYTCRIIQKDLVTVTHVMYKKEISLY